MVTLGSFGFRVGGGDASGNSATPTAGFASGVEPFDRLWEMVPIVVESLIRGGGPMISERVERVEASPWPSSKLGRCRRKVLDLLNIAHSIHGTLYGKRGQNL